MSHYHFVEIRARAYNTIHDYVLKVYIIVNWAQDKNPSFFARKNPHKLKILKSWKDAYEVMRKSNNLNIIVVTINQIFVALP